MHRERHLLRSVKSNFIVKMIASMWFLIFSISFLVNVQSKLISTNNSDDYQQLSCPYSLTTGDRICDCRYKNKKFVLLPLSGNVNNLIVKNCGFVLITEGTFQDVDYIEGIQFRNIEDLMLESNSLELKKRSPIPKIKLVFDKVKFSEIGPYSISGCIDSISFTNCRIEKFDAYSINSIEPMYSISIENTEIDVIDSQALKKMSIEHLILKNTTIWSHFPSRVFSALTISNEISITNCSFTSISPHALASSDVNNLIFSYNNVESLDSEAFQININGRISIERNNFSQFSHSALSAIQLGDAAKNQLKHVEIQFASNIIAATEYPIRIDVGPAFNLCIQNLQFSTAIGCDKMDEFKHNGFLQQYAESVYFNTGKSSNVEYNSLSNIMSSKCVETTYLIAIISATVIVTLILVMVVVTFFYRYWLKHQPKQISVIIPDGKTYRETQIMMQIENAGLLKTNL